MTVIDVTLRIVTQDDIDIVDVGELLDDRLSMYPDMDVRVTKLIEKFDPSRRFNHSGRPAAARTAASLWLAEFLFALGEVPASDVLAEATRDGHAPKTLRRAATEMGVVRSPQGGGHTCAWALPSDVEARIRKERLSGSPSRKKGQRCQ